MTKKFKHKDHVRERKKIYKKLLSVRTPFRNVELEEDGAVSFVSTVEYDARATYMPEEAVKVAKWILDYYGEDPENVFS